MTMVLHRLLVLALAVRAGARARSTSSRSSPPSTSSCRCSASTACSRSARCVREVPFRALAEPLLSVPQRPRLPRARLARRRALARRAHRRSAARWRVLAAAAVWAALWRALSLVRQRRPDVLRLRLGDRCCCEVGFFTIFAGASRTAPNMLADLDLAMDAVPPDVRRRPDQAARRCVLARSDVPGLLLRNAADAQPAELVFPLAAARRPRGGVVVQPLRRADRAVRRTSLPQPFAAIAGLITIVFQLVADRLRATCRG